MPSNSVYNPAIMVTSARVSGSESNPGRTVKNFNQTRSTTGVDNPRWRSLVARGENATTAYTLQTTEQTHDRTNSICSLRILDPFTKKVWVDEYRASGAVLSQYLSGAPAFDSELRAQTESAAIAAFLAKYRNYVAPFKGGVFLGELRETMRMIRGSYGALVGSGLKFHRHWLYRLRHGRFSRRDFYNAYLEATYGWAPLCSDIESALEAYQRLIGKSVPHPFSVLRTDTKHGLLKSTTTSVVGTGARLVLTYQRATSNQVKVRVGGALKTTLTKGPNATKAIKLSGFSWNEFLPTVWELIPYSFLIDYGTNLAEVVCGWFTETSGLGWSYMGTEEVAKEAISARPERPAYHNPPNVTWMGTSGLGDTSIQKSVRYVRKVPVFGLNPNNAHFRINSPSVRRWFNVLILLLQKASREARH